MKNTALLIMDLQPDILAGVPNQAPTILSQAKKLIAAARKSKTPVVYVRVAFRPGYPEVNPNNKLFSAIKSRGGLVIGTPGADIHPDVAPAEGEVVVTKHRVGAIYETDLPTVLRAYDATHIMMAGVATSGVILSTLRYAADHDYKITVVADASADRDEEVHRVLTQKVFPGQADVINVEQALELLA